MEFPLTISNSIAISTTLDLIVAILIIRRLESGKILDRFSRYTLLQLNLLILIICHVIIGKEISLEAGIGKCWIEENSNSKEKYTMRRLSFWNACQIT
jgi:hypothetical protein